MIICREVMSWIASKRYERYLRALNVVKNLTDILIRKYDVSKIVLVGSFVDQHRDNHVMTEYRAHRQMIKTGAESCLDVQLRKQFLNDYQSSERRKPLVFEAKHRNSVDTRENLCFTRFHYQ